MEDYYVNINELDFRIYRSGRSGYKGLLTVLPYPTEVEDIYEMGNNIKDVVVGRIIEVNITIEFISCIL